MEKRTEQILLRASPTQKKRLRERAKSLGLSMTELLLSAALGKLNIRAPAREEVAR